MNKQVCVLCLLAFLIGYFFKQITNGSLFEGLDLDENLDEGTPSCPSTHQPPHSFFYDKNNKWRIKDQNDLTTYEEWKKCGGLKCMGKYFSRGCSKTGGDRFGYATASPCKGGFTQCAETNDKSFCCVKP